MHRSLRIALLVAASALVILGATYWYLRIFPIQKAESTALDEIFVDRQRFHKIESDRIFEALDAINNGRPRNTRERVDCSDPKYNEAGRKLAASKAYNEWVEKARSAERAAIEYAAKRQAKLAAQAEKDAVLRFTKAEMLRSEIECYQMARERAKPSY